MFRTAESRSGKRMGSGATSPSAWSIITSLPGTGRTFRTRREQLRKMRPRGASSTGRGSSPTRAICVDKLSAELNFKLRMPKEREEKAFHERHKHQRGKGQVLVTKVSACAPGSSGLAVANSAQTRQDSSHQYGGTLRTAKGTCLSPHPKLFHSLTFGVWLPLAQITKDKGGQRRKTTFLRK